MTIRVLGCSGAIAAGYKTTAFLLDDDVLIDAGTGVGDLELADMARIDHILVTHAHLDHVLGIPLMADSVMRLRMQAGRPPIQVHALPETLEALRQHLFNGVIWPDFTRLPNSDQPALQLRPLAVGERKTFGQRQVEVLSACHTVPACGYAVDGGEAGHWVFTGDTGPNPALWARLAEIKVAQLIIETAFGNDECELARISQHLCPRSLAQELRQLSQPAEVFITHIKPGEVEAVMQAIHALDKRHTVSALQAGQLMPL